jgi:hypothetical protein
MKNTYILNDYTFANEVEVKLDMLRALVLDRVVERYMASMLSQ